MEGGGPRGECRALLPGVELMAVKLINGDESSEAAADRLMLPARREEESRKARLLPALSPAAPSSPRKANNKVQLPTCAALQSELALVCAFELQMMCRFFFLFLFHCLHSHRGQERMCVFMCTLMLAVCVCARASVKQQFPYPSLTLKGQKLLGSQQWADGGWLNMHLIPFGLVSVSKPPTFLSHNHSYRFFKSKFFFLFFFVRGPRDLGAEMTCDQQMPVVAAERIPARLSKGCFSVCAVFPLRLLGDDGQERPHSEPGDTVLLPKFLRQNPTVGGFFFFYLSL